MPRTFVGFGFGAIQAGLFLWEAQQSKKFDRLVVAMTNEEIVAGLRRAGGRFQINVATRHGHEVGEVTGVEIYNPRVPGDRAALVQAVAEASEMSTALPSIETYEQADASASELLAEGLQEKLCAFDPVPAILYAGENHNHAAEILEQSIRRRLPVEEAAELPALFQPLNTVIGKMSRMVREAGEIAEAGLATYVPGGSRAYLVEEFNRILVSQVTWTGFQRGLAVFEEKADLLPFEEAKLYGHNAAHALLGYLAHRRGLPFIADTAADPALLELVRGAFLEESGAALCARRAGVDPLFTTEGFRAFADDLLERMLNPWLRDDVNRVIRDPRRKLGWDDRLIGTMRLARAAGIEPRRYAHGAAAALDFLGAEDPAKSKRQWLEELWAGASASEEEKAPLAELILTEP